MIAFVRFVENRKTRIGFPGEITPIHNETANRSTVPANEFGGGMQYDMSPPFERTAKIGGSEGIINHQRNLVAVSNFSDLLEGKDIDARIAEGFPIDQAGVG